MQEKPTKKVTNYVIISEFINILFSNFVKSKCRRNDHTHVHSTCAVDRLFFIG